VTKLGYPYGDDLQWRYVQITDASGFNHRTFYVEPLVRVGQRVEEDEPIGEAQDISQRYPAQGMKPHVHYEIKSGDGEYLNPEAAK
jgi:murein DD-endopeptidase MepM/ murein hydrolase activator NlpD